MALQIHSFLCLKAQTMGLNYDLCPTLRYTWAGLSWDIHVMQVQQSSW